MFHWAHSQLPKLKGDPRQRQDLQVWRGFGVTVLSGPCAPGFALDDRVGWSG
jgi:hypothetical protein